MRDDLIDSFAKMEAALGEWSDWMRAYSPSIGYPSRVPMLSTGYGSSPTFEEALGDLDSARMKTIDACVDGLPPANVAAIYRKYDVCAVFRHARPGYTYEMALDDAYAQLLPVLLRRDVIV